jgi:hypothetical protein
MLRMGIPDKLMDSFESLRVPLKQTNGKWTQDIEQMGQTVIPDPANTDGEMVACLNYTMLRVIMQRLLKLEQEFMKKNKLAHDPMMEPKVQDRFTWVSS